MIEWNDSLLIGHAVIDSQHKELVRLLNGLEAAAERGIVTAETRKALEFLSSYASAHFATEESIMSSCDYPDRAIHAVEHITFVARQISFASALQNHDKNTAHDIIAFLKSWINNHISVEDMAFGRWLKDHPSF